MPSYIHPLPSTPVRRAIAIAIGCAVLLAVPAGAAPQAPVAHDGASKAVLPGDDFDRYANGAWSDATVIPPDRSNWGVDAAMAEETNARIVKLIEAVGAGKAAPASQKQVSDYYNAYMDEAAIEAKGMAPLKPLLAKIDALGDKTALAHAFGSSLRSDVDPLNDTNFFTENIFGMWVAQGLSDPSHNMAYLLQGGLGMPERAYYLSDSPKMADLRVKYQAHIAAMLTLAGYDDAEARAARVFALERKIAEVHASREESEDIVKANNVWKTADFAAKAPGLDWNAFFTSAHLADQKNIDVWHPGAVTGIARLAGQEPLSTWKDFLAFHTINHFNSTLPKAVAGQHFAFYSRALSGTPQQSLRWKRALASTNGALQDAVGRMYVERYFPAQSKLRLQAMVRNIIAAFSVRIDKLDWMAPATKAEAQKKLKTLIVGIGYPDHWKTYDGLKIVAHDAFGNALRAEQFDTAQQVAKLHKPVDRSEWAMPAQLVNAVNLPLQNALNFPAAILQPPNFDPKASDALNYGGIGATIGHEISHSFDDQGAQFDAEGRMRDWWTAADLAHFKASSQALAAQYSTYKPFPDLAVNGQQTLSENLADLAGLSAAYDALKASEAGKPVSADTDREFFTGYAESWRTKTRDEALRRQILTDGHAPASYRTATVRNLDAWYTAFDVKPGQALYLAPADRVRAW